MLRRPAFATWFVSIYLLIYVLFLFDGSNTLWQIADGMLLFSPLLIVWMAYTIIRYGIFFGKELKEGEEFGYEDRQ
jgi:hypothetical protein